MDEETLRYCDICGRGLDPNAVGVIGTVLAYRCTIGHLFAGEYSELGVEMPEKSLLWRLTKQERGSMVFGEAGLA